MTLETPAQETGATTGASPKGPEGSPITPPPLTVREDKTRRGSRTGMPPPLEMSKEEVDEALRGGEEMEVDDLESTTKELLEKGASDDEDDGKAEEDKAKKDQAKDDKKKDDDDDQSATTAKVTREFYGKD